MDLSFDEKKRIFEAVCAEGKLAPLELEIFRHLFSNTFPKVKPDALTEKALQGIGSPVGKGSGRRAATIQDIRAKLNDFFELNHSRFPQRLSIDSRPYKIVSGENLLTDSATLRFWEPHLSPETPTIILYTEPLMFTSEDGKTFYRHRLVNAESERPGAIDAKAPTGEGRPGYHYVPTGEMRSTMWIIDFLRSHGTKVDHNVSRLCKDLAFNSGVALGSARTHWLIRELQQFPGFDMEIADLGVSLRNAGPEEQPFYADLEKNPKNPAISYVYVLVCRRPAENSDCTLTMIASNHGRGVERIGRLLTQEGDLEAVWTHQLGWSKTRMVPKAFQLLFRIEVQNTETVPGKVEVVAQRSMT